MGILNILVGLATLFQVSLQAPEAPSIITHSENATAKEWETITLHCNVSGSPVPTVTWWKDNQLLSISGRLTQDSGNSLTITNITKADKGFYYCNGTNNVSSAVSNSAYITVNYPPKISASPQNVTEIEHQPVTFKCTVQGKPISQITWWYNDVKINTSDSVRYRVGGPSSANSSEVSLTIKSLVRGDEGTYRCKAKNSLGTEYSQPAYLTVYYPRKILTSPSGVTKTEEENVTLSCRFEGKPLLRMVEWFANGQKLVINSNSRMTVSLLGDATNATSSLTITNLNRTDEGNYTCVIGNKVTSTSAQLTVNYPPSIILSPNHTNANESSTVTLKCEFLEGKPLPSIIWFKNDALFNSSDSRVVRTLDRTLLGYSATLMILKVERSDEGAYKCHVFNSIGLDISSIAKLTVSYQPKIFTHPRNETRKESHSVTFSCEYEGKPLATVTWKKGDQTITNGGRRTITNPSAVGRATSTLTIDNLNRTDEGSYTCTVKNTVGTVVSSSNTGFLTVNSLSTTTSTPPTLTTTMRRPSKLTILNPNANFTTTENESVTLVCKASSVTSVVITWVRDGLEVKATSTKLSDYMVTSELTIAKVLAKDSGIYKCVAKDAGMIVSTSMRLIVNVPVSVEVIISIQGKEFTNGLRNNSSPQYLELSQNFEKQISRFYRGNVRFKKVLVLEFRSGSIKAKFRVIFEVKVDQPSNQPEPDIRQNMVNVVIDKILKSNGVLGDIRVDPGSLVPLVPPPPPRNLKSTSIKPTQISVAWDSPLHSKHYGVNTYIIQYRKHALKSWTTLKTRKNTGNYVIKNLKPNTVYVISVEAVNDYGKGVRSEIIKIKTLDDSLWAMIWREFKWAVVSVGVALVVLVVVMVFLCYRRSRRRGAKKRDRTRRNVDNFAVPSKDFATTGLEMAQLAARFREIPRDQVLLGEVLGIGQYSQMVSGYLKEDKTHCAIKTLKEGASHQDYRDLMNELEIMSSLDAHPNIINLIGACTVEGLNS